MTTAIRRLVAALAFATSVTSASLVFGQATLAQVDPQIDQKIDGIFKRWTTTTPGCAVGAAVDGQRVLGKAYGMADLEHDVKNTPDTIFEGGSVSKQFTAAAV